MPGQNFTGPGTHVVERLRNSVMPNNKNDFATLLHDIDYLRTAGRKEKQLMADFRAIKNGEPLTARGALTLLGLGSREAIGLTFNKAIPGYSEEETRDIGNKTWEWLKQNAQYADLFEKYGVDSNEYEHI